MPRRHQEISRFTASGKTFFFNKGLSSTGSEYLGVNALYGKGNQERLVVFPSQMLDFYKHYLDAMGHLTGLQPSNGDSLAQDPGEATMPGQCPGCGSGWSAYAVTVVEPDWMVSCQECDWLLFATDETAFEVETNAQS